MEPFEDEDVPLYTVGQVAQMLADFYDTRHSRIYRMSPSLARFVPHFLAALRDHRDVAGELQGVAKALLGMNEDALAV